MKDRTLLMIPGPVEFEPAVLGALGHPTASHVAPDFIEIFGACIEQMRKVWMAPSSQPLILAGTGTLAMDTAGANLVEPGDKTLVISTGFFGERFAELLKRYGAEVAILRAPLGGIVESKTIEAELKKSTYKLMVFTHVDTSTGVLMNPVEIGKLGLRYDVLTVLDGVCSVAGEEIRQEEWGIDVVLTASQKAIGVPPGLALLAVGPKAMSKWRSRKTPVLNYYGDWGNWLPIMEAYEARKPSYFGTPAVNHICALHVSLSQVLNEGLEKRFKRHKRIGDSCKAAASAIGLKQVPLQPEFAASTMTALYYPDTVNGPELLSKIKEAGVVLAGGLHPDIKAKYFRIGHMGAVKPGDILATIGAIETGLARCGHSFETGRGVYTVQEYLSQ